MRITSIDTLHVAAYLNITVVEIRTDDGLGGWAKLFAARRRCLRTFINRLRRG